ncbi:Ig-like domain-containing protein [Actinoplanes sp. CA-252034]|uniref:Ig-like domain-containing protein n=1 Tax=Actinoplanes sp. CA-252034 TaxID=3239906 RepID=UPI003D97A6C2
MRIPLTHSLLRWALAGTAAVVASTVLAAPAAAAADPVLLSGATPRVSAVVGADFDVALSVTNTGSTPLTGAGVLLHTDWAFEPAEQFSNCDYRADGRARLCTFGQTLEPGRSYRIVLPYKVRPDTYAPGSAAGEFEWRTADKISHNSGDTPGAGGPLELRQDSPLPGYEGGSFATVDLTVTGTNTPDLVAIGDEVSGAAGDLVQATVGVRNDGTATLDRGRSGETPAEVEVTLPAGTSFVSAPGCRPGEASNHVCAVGAPYLFTAGATYTWTFTLKIDQVVADAQGTVQVNPPCECVRPSDADRSDNTALLTVNPTTGSSDRIPPVIASTGLLDGQRAPADLVFHPATADNLGVTELQATVNGTVAAACTVTEGCKVSLASLPTNTIATVTVRAGDAAGNQSEKSTRVRVDNVLPSAILSPAPGSSVPAGPVTITLSGVAADVWRIDALEGELRTGLPGDPWAYTWNAVAGAASPRFVLRDYAGNITTIETGYTVTVDDQPPVITQVDFVGSYSTNRLDTSTGWVGGVSTLRPTINDESAIVRTEWAVDGVVRSSDRTFSWDARTFAASAATVRLQVWDAAGNTASKSFVVNIDRTGPTMTIAPGNRALIRGTSYLTSVKAADPHGVAVTNLAGRTGSVTSVRVASGRDGVKTITWVAVDGLGNPATATRAVIVDNTAPALKVTKAPKNRSKLTRKVTIAASASDRNGVAKVQLLVNGKVVATDAKAAYSFALNPKKYGRKLTVQLRAYDRAGNVRYSGKLTYRR